MGRGGFFLVFLVFFRNSGTPRECWAFLVSYCSRPGGF